MDHTQVECYIAKPKLRAALKPKHADDTKTQDKKKKITTKDKGN